MAAAVGCLLLAGCIHKPFRSGSRVVDPALLALGDSERSSLPDAQDDVKYMFCVPNNAMIRAEVMRIDPSLRFYDGVQARRDCGSHALVCVGSVCQPGFMAILDRLSKKPYIKSITLASLDYYH